MNNAWVTPQGVTDELATVEVEILVRADGQVIRARIVGKTGIAALDRSVQDALNRVPRLPPFEDGATDKERTFSIGFNLRGKRSF